MRKASLPIILRGNNREKIFIDEEDKSRIINTLGDKKKAEEYYLYAYCVMDNHIHLIIKEDKDPIAHTIKRLLQAILIISIKNTSVLDMYSRKDLRAKTLKMKLPVNSDKIFPSKSFKTRYRYC